MMRKKENAFLPEMPVLHRVVFVILAICAVIAHASDLKPGALLSVAAQPVFRSQLASTDAASAKSTKAPSRSAKTKKTQSSVLKLSNEEQPDAVNIALSLKLSDSLPMPAQEQVATTMTAKERAEQTWFAAILRDEDPVLNADAQVKASQAEVELLRAETIQVRKQGLADKAALEASRIQFSNWIMALGTLLATCAGIMGWLLWRLFGAPRNVNTSWDQAVTRNKDETATFVFLEGATKPDNTELDKLVTVGLNKLLVMDRESVAAAPAQEQPASPAVSPAQASDERSANEGSVDHQTLEAQAAEAQTTLEAANHIEAHHDQLTRKHQDAGRVHKAKQISNLVQRAQFWMSLNNPIRALVVLKAYRDLEESESPVPWIWLLDVYRALDNQEKYEVLGQQLRNIFKLDVPAFSEKDRASSNTLEKFPDIVEKISELWEGDEIVPYLESLLIDDCDGSRAEFTMPIYRDIMQMIMLAIDSGLSQRKDQRTLDKAHTILFGLHEPAAETVEFIDSADEQMGVPEEHSDEDLYATRALSDKDAQEAALRPNLSQALSNEHDDLSDMTTKIHLAIVYQEIDDHNGARLLLEEVIKEGSPSQVQQARLMMARLK